MEGLSYVVTYYDNSFRCLIYMGTIIPKAAAHLILCRPTLNNDRRMHHVDTRFFLLLVWGDKRLYSCILFFLVLVLVMETNADLFGDF